MAERGGHFPVWSAVDLHLQVWSRCSCSICPTVIKPNDAPSIRIDSIYLHMPSASAAPEWRLPQCKIPHELNIAAISLAKGPQIPWKTWKMEAPLLHTKFCFSSAEPQNIYLRVAAKTTVRISHQDALLAYVWAALTHARGLEEREEHCMDVSVDIRRFLFPTSAPPSPTLPIPQPYPHPPILRISNRTLAERQHSSATLIMKFDADSTACLLHEWVAFRTQRSETVELLSGGSSQEGVRSLWVEPLMPALKYGFHPVFSPFNDFVSCKLYFRSNDFMHICYESGPYLQGSYLKRGVPREKRVRTILHVAAPCHGAFARQVVY